MMKMQQRNGKTDYSGSSENVLDWEKGNEEVRNLWSEMNTWLTKVLGRLIKDWASILIRFNTKATLIS